MFETDRRGVIRWNGEYGKPGNKIMREIQRVSQLQMVLKCIPINPDTEELEGMEESCAFAPLGHLMKR